MTTVTASSQSTRSTLVAEISRQLERETFPRVIVLVMLLAAGGAAFFCAVLALRGGVESMAGRYALATASGYFVFLLLIRLWIGVRRGWSPDINGPDVVDGVDLFSGTGGSGHAGSSDTLADAASHGFDFSFDADELWWLVLALVIAAAGLVAVAFVVYAAPVLLAEVALDAALVGTAYRRLRREDQGWWATTALRKTWGSAAVAVTSMAVVGFALQRFAPEAVSIGDVLRHFLVR